MLLTVSVPTYNRNARLYECMCDLLPQLTAECHLRIIDNCSDVPVEETLQGLFVSFPHASVEVVRNRTNIGGSANVLRCFELCTTEWLWSLGDDDQIAPDAIQTIVRQIIAYPDSVFFNFRQGRAETVTTAGLDGLVQAIDSFGSILFMAGGVYRVASLLPHLRVGYHYAYAMAPHTALLLAALNHLGSAGICQLSGAAIAVNSKTPPPSQQWSLVNMHLGMMLLLELPMSQPTRQKLAAEITDGMPNLEASVVQLISSAARSEVQRATATYLYDQVRTRWTYAAPPSVTMKSQVYRLLFLAPAVSYNLLQLVYRLVKRRDVATMQQDRFGRM